MLSTVNRFTRWIVLMRAFRGCDLSVLDSGPMDADVDTAAGVRAVVSSTMLNGISVGA